MELTFVVVSCLVVNSPVAARHGPLLFRVRFGLDYRYGPLKLRHGRRRCRVQGRSPCGSRTKCGTSWIERGVVPPVERGYPGNE